MLKTFKGRHLRVGLFYGVDLSYTLLPMNRNRLTTIILIGLTTLVSAYFVWSQGRSSITLYGDALGYYLYLPSTFIYDNHLSVTELPSDYVAPSDVSYYLDGMKQTGTRSSKGYVINQYTYGVALMETPFFLLAHLYETFIGGVPDGYSQSYIYAIKISSLVYSLLGLLLTYHVLKVYFSRQEATIGSLLIFIGTNLFWFTIYQAGMAHVPLFFLYAALIYLTIKVHERPRLFDFLQLGFVLGLICVIRPTDILAITIPLLYCVVDRSSLKLKILYVKHNWKNILLASVMFILPIIPQLIYWKILTGSLVFYSYGDQGFDWSNPKIIEGLFLFNNGWLAYSPIMIFSLLGLFFFKSFKTFSTACFLILPIYIYIIYSWYCYNYINGLGSRPMIHIYPLLAMPLTAFVHFTSRTSKLLRFGLGTVMMLFVAINISYSFQRSKQMLISEESTFLFNATTLFKNNLTYSDLLTLDLNQIQPNQSTIQFVKNLGCQPFDDSISENYVADTEKNNGFVYATQKQEHHPAHLSAVYDSKLFNQGSWIKVSGRFMVTEGQGFYQHLLVTEIKRGDYLIDWQKVKIDEKIGLADSSCEHNQITLRHYERNKWGYVYFLYRLPKNLQNGDVINISVWNIGKQEMFMDDLCLELFSKE